MNPNVNVAVAALLIGSLGLSSATAVTPATLVGPDLEPRAVHLTAVRDGRIGFFDDTRELRNVPLADYVQLRGFPAPPADQLEPTPDTPAPAGMIELIDGTRLTGRLRSVGDDGQTLQWTNDILGDLDITLDDLAAVSLREPLGRIDPPAADRVVLTNGDVIEGFLEALVAVRTSDQQRVEAPVDRLDRLVLSSPRRIEALDRVYLADGGRLPVRSLAIVADALTAEIALPGGTREATWPLHAVRRIDLGASGLGLLQLSEVPLTVAAGGKVFGVAWPPIVQSDQILMHAPVTVAFELPAGARRFAARAELHLEGVPVHARPLADCVLIVESPGQSPQRFALNAAQPGVDLNLPAAPGKLTITLDPGPHGPALDRVRLTDAVILVQSP